MKGLKIKNVQEDLVKVDLTDKVTIHEDFLELHQTSKRTIFSLIKGGDIVQANVWIGSRLMLNEMPRSEFEKLLRSYKGICLGVNP